ncbi:ADP-ribosylglycohydrolase [Spinactinospora alkalitolerans]|uniref:ADP-ribosylglycohydrolase n=1 Tax=Spinactinospora alkalitolerans TaxID=687207 RepID=A0A852TS44_9ACTN|nr:ADP-ribosylglycohydrolase family protein [Spinactinospora alkalitolerans]NYE47206.1 ADP-ribosylglycohydrolase [Spinactinospora alkalitolerans]
MSTATTTGGGRSTPRADVADRVRGAFLGLAIGDAAGWPARRHRFGLLAPWTRRLHRELDLFAEEHAVTALPVPFALNQPVEALRIGPSDDAEWLAWTAATIDRDRAEAFTELAGRDDVRARISVRTALDNLARGLHPPTSGHDNPHHFDDAAAVRAVAFGCLHPGAPEWAARAARADAEVTNSGDGVDAAAAVAAAIALAVDGAAPEEVLSAGGELSADGAARATLRAALDVAPGAETPFEVLPDLEDAVWDHVYSYGVAAGPTLAVALTLAWVSRGAVETAVPAAACLAPLADSAPALTGALTGAVGGHAALPRTWRERAGALAGCCLPEFAGHDLLDYADAVAARACAQDTDDDEGAC